MDCGGSAVNTLLSASEQSRSGHQVTLAYGPSSESNMSQAEQAKVDNEIQTFKKLGGKITILPSMLRGIGLHDWRAYLEIKKLLQQDFDIVHTHTSKAGALGRLAANNERLIHTAHGHIFHGYFGTLKSNIFILIERFLARKSTALIALTKAELNDHLALSIGKPEQWHVIPSGVDIHYIEQHTQQLRNEVNWDAVSVGRLVPIKGMNRLILAWAQVCQLQPNAKLALVGDGEERQALELLTHELGIEKNIHFAGWSDPIPYLAASRRFALLSYNEGMGRAVVEAFAAGLPCIVSNVCGLRELVDDSVGCVVDAEQPEKVAKALLKDWNDQIHHTTKERAKSYSVETMIHGLEELYQNVHT